MAASSSNLLSTSKPSSLSHRCSLSRLPSPLPSSSPAANLPKLSVVFAINAKPTVLVAEKLGEGGLDLKPYLTTIGPKKPRKQGLLLCMVLISSSQILDLIVRLLWYRRRIFRLTCHGISAAAGKAGGIFIMYDLIFSGDFCSSSTRFSCQIVSWFWVGLV